MKKNYTLLTAVLLLQLLSFSQMHMMVAGFGGTGNCDATMNLLSCTSNVTYNIVSSNGPIAPTPFAINMCSGTYIVTITSSTSGATASVTLNYSNNGQVAVTPAAGSTVFSAFARIISSTSTSVCNGSIFLDIQGGTPPYSITWYDAANQVISGQSNDTLNNVCPNGYGFKVTDNSNFCNTAGVMRIPNLSTGILSNQKEKNISIYPNPTNGVFNVDLQDSQNMFIELIDVLGNTVYKTVNQGQPIQFDLSSESDGVYFIRTIGLNGMSNVKKLIKN